jgi:hypothetical protein
MKTALSAATIASVGLMALATTAYAQDFIVDSTFNVVGTATPGDVNAPTVLTTTGIAHFITSNNQGLALQINQALSFTHPGGEWLVFSYNAAPNILSPNQGNWSLNEVGLDAGFKLDIWRGFVQFYVNGQFDVIGTPVAFNSSPFGNFAPASAPPSDLASILSGPGLFAAGPTVPTSVGGPGPLGSLGSFIDPFSLLDSHLAGGVTADTITGYTEALEFSPAGSVGPSIPEPSTWAMMALGFGFLGFLGYRKTRGDNALA